jgi:hypothetical protein
VGGLTSKGIIAPMLLDGAMNGDCFEAYVDQVLSKATKPGDLVILDNLSSHKTTKARKAFERNKIRFLFLPPKVLTSIPLKMHFHNSRVWPVQTRKGQSRGFGTVLTKCCPLTVNRNAETTSDIADITLHN